MLLLTRLILIFVFIIYDYHAGDSSIIRWTLSHFPSHEEKDPDELNTNVQVNFITTNKVYRKEIQAYDAVKKEKVEKVQKEYEQQRAEIGLQHKFVREKLEALVARQSHEEEVKMGGEHAGSRVVQKMERAASMAKKSPIMRSIVGSWQFMKLNTSWLFSRSKNDSKLSASQLELQLSLNRSREMELKQHELLNKTFETHLKTVTDHFENNIKEIRNLTENNFNVTLGNFEYNFLNDRVKADNFNKLFEMPKNPMNFYILTTSNKKHPHPDGNKHNPFFSEVTLSRYDKSKYIGNYQPDYSNQNLFSHAQRRQGEVCLLDYIPGMVQKVAFNQYENDKVALVYRILKDIGYQYRIRIYQIQDGGCGGRYHPKEILESAAKTEDLFLNDEYVGSGSARFQDFKLDTTSQILAISLFGGDRITYSADPDIYKFRVLKYDQSQEKWQEYQYGPVVNRLNELVYFCISISYVEDHLGKDQIIVTEIIKRSRTQQTFDVKITNMMQSGGQVAEEPLVRWAESSSMLERQMKLDKGVDGFTKQVYQNQMATVSHRHHNNQIFNVFGDHLVAVQKFNFGRLCSFDSFPNKKQSVDIVSPLPNNERVLLYSADSHKIYALQREYAAPDGRNLTCSSTKVKETWHQIKLMPHDASQNVSASDGFWSKIPVVSWIFRKVKYLAQTETWYACYKRVSKFSIGFLLGHFDESRTEAASTRGLQNQQQRHEEVQPFWLQRPEYLSDSTHFQSVQYQNEHDLMAKLRAQQQPNFFPKILSDLKLVDMTLNFNRQTNCTVLIALMEGGVLASFEVEQNYTPAMRETYQRTSRMGGMHSLHEMHHVEQIIYPSTESEILSNSQKRRNFILYDAAVWLLDSLTLRSVFRGKSIYNHPNQLDLTNASMFKRFFLYFFDFANKTILIISNFAIFTCFLLILKLAWMRVSRYANSLGFNASGWLYDLYESVFGAEEGTQQRPASRRNTNAAAGLMEDGSQDSTQLRLERDVNSWIEQTQQEGRLRDRASRPRYDIFGQQIDPRHQEEHYPLAELFDDSDDTEQTDTAPSDAAILREVHPPTSPSTPRSSVSPHITEVPNDEFEQHQMDMLDIQQTLILPLLLEGQQLMLEAKQFRKRIMRELKQASKYPNRERR